VQVEPIKPMLKAPGTKRLKRKCGAPLSNFAFKFDLRRYTMVAAALLTGADKTELAAAIKAGRFSLTLSHPH